MKLPYRVGDSFALPLGDGTTVEATIVARDHHAVEIEVADLTLRVRDNALVLRRWHVVQGGAGPSSFEAPGLRPIAPQDDKGTVGPARAERIVATHLGVPNLELPPLRVHNQWRPEFPDDARYVRIAGRGRTFDPRELARYANLEALALSGVALTSLDFPPTLRALRLAWIGTPIDLRALARLPLHTLSLEGLRHAYGVDALAAMTSLEQLEMLGFWQLQLDDVMPLPALPKLVRAEIDIGGRRKNVELYKRATWAYPWPFEVCANVLAAT